MTAPRVLVLGGTGLVGSAVLAALAARGAALATTWHTREDAARALTEKTPGLECSRLDARSATDTRDAVLHAARALGGLDAVVHCIAIGTGVPNVYQRTRDITEDDWDAVMAVNVRSAFFAAQALASLDLAGGANVVLVGSIDGVRPVPSSPHYATSKAALVGLGQSLAKELGPRNIKVNTVASGLLDGGLGTLVPNHLRQEFVKHSALGRFGKASEVAAVIAWLAVENTYVSGRTLMVDGGL